MEINDRNDSERYILPTRLVNLVQDGFDIILSIIILGIVVGALFFTLKDILTMHPFFPTGMINGINNVLFVVIILEIFRTVISKFTDGLYQLDKFLVIGVIASVRHILTVGATLTFESDKGDSAFYRTLWELGVDAGIALILVIALFVSKSAQARKIVMNSAGSANSEDE
jgi:uncharacterized membrane protein (DUF373 family)